MFLKINKDKIKAKLNPNMIGLFFEDINYGADGGLYAEMLENRSFDFFPTRVEPYNSPLIAWRSVGECELVSRTQSPMNDTNPRYAHISGKAGSGIENRAYEGCYLEAGEEYEFSFYSRGSYGGKLTFSLISGGETVASAEFDATPQDWERRGTVVTASKTVYDAVPQITLSDEGELDIDMCSLFPIKTYNNRKNGLRADMVQALADVKPGFLRFPGGCIVEGNGLSNRYRWKDSIGPIETRRGNWNRWQDGGVGVMAPDYYQSLGLGFYEYFLLCEDLKCEPLPVLNCGMGCQYQCEEIAPLDELDEYIQDALDLIEFANGSVETLWGARRAELGHDQPFGLKYLAIGNEQWDEEYFARYEEFQRILAKKHPEIMLISSSGPYCAGKEFENAWGWLEGRGRDFAYAVDEHYYVPAEWMLKNTHRYDNYDRSMPKIFAGEYACHLSVGQPRPNNLKAALAEAAMMTGFERNGDVVWLAAYAPLFARENFTQWTPDLIFVNNHEIMLTPSYYVQKMFGNSVPDYVTRFSCNCGENMYISAGMKGDEAIVKLVNMSDKKRKVNFECSTGQAEYLTADGRHPKEILEAKNTMEEKYNVAPVSETFNGSEYELKPFSFTVVKYLLKERRSDNYEE